jgi:homeobox protein cut-like
MDSFAITESIIPQSDNQDDRAPESGTSGALSEGANKFQRAIAAWRGTLPPQISLCRLSHILISSLSVGIDLSNTLAKLDSTASDIVAEQRDALVQRKDLAQKTKDFRKLDDASKLTEYKGLLKGSVTPRLGHSGFTS